jgi:predicted metal-binding protein
MQRMKNSSAPMIVKSRRANLVLICRKCLKRADDGKDVKRGLKAELKARGAKKSQRPRLILTNCFGVCPKRAVVTASAHTLRRGEFLLVSDRSSMSDAADALLEIQD